MAPPQSEGYKPYQVNLHREIKEGKNGGIVTEDILTLSFGSRATNDVNCVAAVRRIEELIATGRFASGADLLRITGPSAISIAFGLGLALQPVTFHYKEVVIFDGGLARSNDGKPPFIVVYAAPDSQHTEGDRVG